MFGAAARACRRNGEKVAMGTTCGRWVLVTTVLASSMAFLDDTVVTLALPTIEREFGAGLSGLQWILNGYLVVLGSLILLGGRFGDVFGRRKVLIAGLAVFAAASALAALAPSIGLLIAARSLQGVGAALMIPSSLAIITATFRPQDQGQAIGIWSALTALAVASGPLVGGWLVDTASWRWVFLINLPLAAGAITAALRYVPETRDEAESGHLDLVGGLLAIVALALLTFAPVQGGELGWDHPLVLGALAGGAILMAVFLAVESRSPHPMLPLGIFRIRQFTGANLAPGALRCHRRPVLLVRAAIAEPDRLFRSRGGILAGAGDGPPGGALSVRWESRRPHRTQATHDFRPAGDGSGLPAGRADHTGFDFTHSGLVLRRGTPRHVRVRVGPCRHGRSADDGCTDRSGRPSRRVGFWSQHGGCPGGRFDRHRAHPGARRGGRNRGAQREQLFQRVPEGDVDRGRAERDERRAVLFPDPRRDGSRA